MRCFLRDIPDQCHRYEMLTDFIKRASLPGVVRFEYLAEGINIQNRWFPILKMQWVEGITLDKYLERHWQDKEKLDQIANQIQQISRVFFRNGVAHGDLQHGNIIIVNDKVHLVDYDGFFVPSLQGQKSNELGHVNYQHPLRSSDDFGADIDNFSAWLIYGSLRILSLDPNLWRYRVSEDDLLLFHSTDLRYPDESKLFKLLESHENRHIRDLCKKIHINLAVAPNMVPRLQHKFWSITLTVTKKDHDSLINNTADRPARASVDSPARRAMEELMSVRGRRNYVSYHYMVEQIFWIARAALLGFALCIMISGGLMSMTTFRMGCITIGSLWLLWVIRQLFRAKLHWSRLRKRLLEEEPVTVMATMTYVTNRAEGDVGDVEMQMCSNKPETGRQKWMLRDHTFRRECAPLINGKSQVLRLYLNPGDGSPVAIFSGEVCYWLDPD